MTTRTRLDLFKRYRNEYVAPKQPRLIQIESAQYLSIATDTAPATSDPSMDADPPTQVKALYAIASALRTVATAIYQRDFILGKIEWLLCSHELSQPHQSHVMMRIPNFITPDDLAQAVTALVTRDMDKAVLHWIHYARLETMSEGSCLQVLHAGPNTGAAQGQTLALLQNYARTHGFETTGPSHAVYLANSRHVPPEHLRTLLRLPVRTLSAIELSPV